MRTTILAGLIMIAIGASALYQTRNGFFMFMVGHATYWPPTAADAVQSEFDALGEVKTSIKEVRLADAAAAQAICVERLSGQSLPAGAARAFERFNLVLLGAGQNALSPIIPPDVRRVPELRRDLTQPDRDYYDPDLRARDEKKLRAVIDDLSEPEHAIYTGLDLRASFGHIDLKNQVEALLNAGERLHQCTNGT
ncbi:MAG: hypothetical protein AAF367_05705 [Pseudomonadota bacterium]